MQPFIVQHINPEQPNFFTHLFSEYQDYATNHAQMVSRPLLVSTGPLYRPPQCVRADPYHKKIKKFM